jgi:hypothetical protein
MTKIHKKFPLKALCRKGFRIRISKSGVKETLSAGDLLNYLPSVFLDLEEKKPPQGKRINDRLLRIFPIP